MFDVGCLIFDVKNRLRSRCAPQTSTINNQQSNIPRGISLIEILVSIFVLLFGLMGVAAVFPVGNHYVIEGEKFDLGSSLAQNAFEELKARGMLRPRAWLYADTTSTAFLNADTFLLPFGTGNFGPGLALVIDPLGGATIPASNVEIFPFGAGANMPTTWADDFKALNPVPSFMNQPGTRWPIRRLTLPQTPGNPLQTPVAETIFRLSDDLAVEQPKEADRPSIQNLALDGNRKLRRQYKGDYSWLATVVPTSTEALAALQPAVAANAYGELLYDVSVVVFRKREITPSATSERLIQAKLGLGGEVIFYVPATQPDDKLTVDKAVADIRPGNWIALTGVNQTTGDFMMKWYRILALDDETQQVNGLVINNSGGTVTKDDVYLRRASVEGPNWPSTSIYNLGAVILPDTINVATQQMKMEQ